MKFKYLVEQRCDPVNEGILSWVKSKMRGPMDYYNANKSVLRDYMPIWTEKWNSPDAGKCEGVRFVNYKGETIRVCFADMGGDMTMITSLDYKATSSDISCPDYVCVFDKPVQFSRIFPVIERLFKEGRTGRDALRANGAMFAIKNGSPDRANSTLSVFDQFMDYWHRVGDAHADSDTVTGTIIGFYKKYIGTKLKESAVYALVSAQKFLVWTDCIIKHILTQCELLRGGCVSGSKLATASTYLRIE